MRSLEKILKDYFKDGLYSHVYCAAGYLGEQAPRLEIVPSQVNPHAQEEFFDLSSLTKILVGSPLAFDFMREKGFSLDEAIGPSLPKELNNNKYLHNISFYQLLTHTAGLPFWKNFWMNQFDAKGNLLIERAYRQMHILKVLGRLDKPTQRGYCYSDISIVLLTMILENHFGENIAEKIFAFLC